jgi:hypothetical protein
MAEDQKSAWVAEVLCALHLTLPEKEELAKDCENASMRKIAEIRLGLSESRKLLVQTFGRRRHALNGP